MDEPLNALELNAVYLIHVSESTSPSNYPLPSKKKKNKPAIKCMVLDHFLPGIIIWENLGSHQKV